MTRRWLQVVLLTLLVCCQTAAAYAHALRPATLALRELAPGRFHVAWTPPTASYGLAEGEPIFPEHCQLAEAALDCGTRGLDGTIDFPAIEGSTLDVMVHIRWLGGQELLRSVSGDAPTLRVRGIPADADTRLRMQLALDYTRLGIQHIVTGLDHLLFVLGLMLLIGLRRPLWWTVTAFTVAHSITLAAAALELVRLPPVPVEAVIALSVLLLAVECASRTDMSLTRRAPWLVAFAFGLLHGFGFAGVLSEVGLPPHQTPLALLFFNLGVELGQLALIAIAWLLWKAALPSWQRSVFAHRSAVYVMGTLAAYWSIERTALLLCP